MERSGSQNLNLNAIGEFLSFYCVAPYFWGLWPLIWFFSNKTMNIYYGKIPKNEPGVLTWAKTDEYLVGP